MSNGLEILGWFIYFWLFMFSRKFRNAWIQEFKEAGAAEKGYKAWEALVSVIFGLAPFVALGYFVLR